MNDVRDAWFYTRSVAYQLLLSAIKVMDIVDKLPADVEPDAATTTCPVISIMVACACVVVLNALRYRQQQQQLS